MLADLRVLHVPSSDTNVLPPVILQFGADRYLFNVGEGTSRSSTQRKANLSRVSNIFVSRVGWEAIGGLPGVLMSMADGQRSTESLHGPDGLRYALATMRTYAKRDIMKLIVNEIPAQAGPSHTNTNSVASSETNAPPFFTDDNLSVHAVSLFPASTSQRVSKKQKIETTSSAGISMTVLNKVDQLWRRPYFNPSGLEGEEARAWIQLISDSIFNDSLLRKRQQQLNVAAEAVPDTSASRQLVSSIDDVEMQDADQAQATSSSQARAHSPWRPPLSPAFVTRLLPRPQTDTRNLSTNRSDPAEGGQAPVLAFVCEAHPQRGKFDPVKATQAGVSPGPSFAALTRGEDVTFQRPVSWSSMSPDERKRWTQSQRSAQRGANANANGKGKANDAKNAAPPAAWNHLEQVTVKSTDVMGPSRAGAVVLHIYLPSVDYVDDLLSDRVAAAFSPYTSDANRHLNREQSRTPHAIVHAVPFEVLQDARYQAWMRRYGPDCHHIVANHHVCANKLMFPSSATIPLRLSKLDEVMFKVPQYQLAPKVSVSALAKAASNGKAAAANHFPLKLVAAEADQLIPLQPRGEPKRFESGAPDFDFAVQSEQADKLAAFELDVVEETERQSEQLAKAKAQNKKHARDGVEAAVDVGTDEPGAVRNVRLREARKQAWQVYLDVVKKIQSDSATSSAGVAPEKDILVTTLGTGSAAPSKYRNVISTLIQTPSSGTILLDAGESTYGLLRRKFGCRRDGTAAESGSLLSQDVDDILREIRVLFISHIHADHHIGLIRLLLERRRLEPRPDQPLYLIGTGFVHNYLEEYEQIEKLGLDEDVVLVLNDHLDHAAGVDPNPSTEGASLDTTISANGNSDSRGYQQARREHVAHVQAIKQVTGLSHVHTARVVHRGSHCYGLVLRHTTQNWSVAYSGDTRPAPELVAAGKDCKLLIHEATLEDGELEMAIGKGHSTFGEAIRVGHEMGAHNILLTHFSQRYPKMARSSLFALGEQGGKGGKNVPIALAFDMVTYPLSQFSKIQGYTPAMEALFAADTEGDDEAHSIVGEGKADVTSSSKAQGNGNQSKKQASGGGAKGSRAGAAGAAAAAGTLGIAATNEDADSKAVEANADQTDNKPSQPERPPSTERYVRKGMKPSEWRYLGLRLSPSPSTSTLPTILPTFVLELVHTAQTATMGAAGGAYNVDVLSVHASHGGNWDAVLRVEARHGPELATCLGMLPAPTVQNVRLRLSVVGPTTAVQTVQNLVE